MSMITYRLGRRGAFLLHISLIWLAMGVIAWGTSGSIDPLNAIVYEKLPVWMRVGLWWVTAAFAFLGACRRRFQNVGWWAAAVMPAERLIGHGWSLFHWLVPGDPPGAFGSSLGSMILWGGVLSLILTAAAMSEDVVTLSEEREAERA